LAASIILIHLLLYGKWFMWHGGFAWGPRFMIPTLPFWALFLGPVAARAFPDKKRSADRWSLALRIAYLTLAILGLIPQFLSVTLDFAPFQTVLLDTGLPLFAPQTFFDPQYSPLIRAWALFATEPLDLAWAWQDQLTGWLLAILLVNIVITGFYLMRSAGALHPTRRAAKDTQGPRPTLYVLRATWLPLLSTLITLLSLLLYAHSLPSSPVEQAVTVLNQNIRPTDAVIINDPDMTIPFAELYKGRAPVLGLHSFYRVVQRARAGFGTQQWRLSLAR
jgi:hypothetical protein